MVSLFLNHQIGRNGEMLLIMLSQLGDITISIIPMWKNMGNYIIWCPVSDSRGIAPIVWHVPNIVEWMILRDYLGVNEYCDAMKSSNGWQYKETAMACKNCDDWKDEYKSKGPSYIYKDTRKVTDVCQNSSNSSFFNAMQMSYFLRSLISGLEMKFLAHLCHEEEYTYDQIAHIMGVHVRTVDGFRKSLFQKLNIRSKTGLVMLAIRKGWV
jgi:uncharacterized protein (TIGR02145 family)